MMEGIATAMNLSNEILLKGVPSPLDLHCMFSESPEKPSSRGTNSTVKDQEGLFTQKKKDFSKNPLRNGFRYVLNLSVHTFMYMYRETERYDLGLFDC